MDCVSTWTWSSQLSIKYHELVIEFVRYIPQNWFRFLPHSKFGRYLKVLFHEYSYINLCQVLGSQAHLKRIVGSRNMKIYVKSLLKIWKAFNIRRWILTIVYSKDIYNNHIGYFLFINLRMEGSGFGQAWCLSWTSG